MAYEFEACQKITQKGTYIWNNNVDGERRLSFDTTLAPNEVCAAGDTEADASDNLKAKLVGLCDGSNVYVQVESCTTNLFGPVSMKQVPTFWTKVALFFAGNAGDPGFPD